MTSLLCTPEILVREFRRVRDLPYAIPLAPGDKDLSCVGKHELFKTFLEQNGVTVRWRVCRYRWSDLALPETVRAFPHENEATHAYLEIHLRDTWFPVDLTWDESLRSILPIAAWDGLSATISAVPVLGVFTPEESLALIEVEDVEKARAEDLAKNGEFLKAFNSWLADARVRASQYPKVGIGCIVFKDGKILLGKRTSSHGAQEYGWPGGGMEYLESFAGAVHREVFEEAGIEIQNLRFVSLVNLRQYAPKHYVDLCFMADWKSGEPRVCEPDKMVEWAWYPLEQLPEPLFQGSKEALQALQSGQVLFDV